MVVVARNLVQYDIGVQNVASFIAASAITVAGAFVQMSSTQYVIKHVLNSGTVRPLGVTTGSAIAGSTGNEVRTGGYIWQLTYGTMTVGAPVYPSSTIGRVRNTGKTLSGATLAGARAALFQGGFGTTITAATGSAQFVLTKLQGLV